MVCSLEKDMRADEVINKCDAAHEKVPNGWNGVISMVVQRTYKRIKQKSFTNS